jgi:hypothetical protein
MTAVWLSKNRNYPKLLNGINALRLFASLMKRITEKNGYTVEEVMDELENSGTLEQVSNIKRCCLVI